MLWLLIKFVLFCVVVLASILAGSWFSWIIWRHWLSIRVVPPWMVAICLYFGDAQPIRYTSGKVFVPYIPIKWDGYHPWELIMIPTKPIPFHLEGKLGHRVWSSDRQLLLVEVSGYVRFPYSEVDSLILMIQAGVPTHEKELQEWMEEEVISGLRDIMAGFTLEQAIQRSNLTAISAAAEAFFLRPDGLFAKSGICGNNPSNFSPGTGEVILRVEQVSPTQKVQEAMEAPFTAKHLAIAAKEVAKRRATEVGDPIMLAMDAWVNSQVNTSASPPETSEMAKARLVASGAYVKHEQLLKDFILAQGGNLDVFRAEVGAPDGSPMKGDLAGWAAIAALFGGGRGGSHGGRGGGRRRKAEDMTDEELEKGLSEE